MYKVVTNADRAEWARAAIKTFTEQCGSSGELVTDAGDLIVDLLHLIRREEGLSCDEIFNVAHSKATMHHTEVLEDPEQ